MAEFQHGLCGCFSDCGSCCMAWWCPCIAHGKSNNRNRASSHFLPFHELKNLQKKSRLRKLIEWTVTNRVQWRISCLLYFLVTIRKLSKIEKHVLTRRLSGFEILNNAILIFQKWLVSRIFANICHYLNFSEEY